MNDQMLDPGLWIQDLGSGSCIETLDLGSWIGSWIQGPGFRILDPKSWTLDKVQGFNPGSKVLDPGS